MQAIHMNRRANSSRNENRRSGFTLVEMMIAVALVLLMMTLFAQVFELASGSITLQQALGENDQQVRTFTTLLRSDLRKRTNRVVAPFHENQTGSSIAPFNSRRGYLYLSTNDPNNPRDTVLQFTIQSTILVDSSDETPYYGKATALTGDFLDNENQPEHDDGQVSRNGAASSTAAQVAYFMRGGRLYRRVVLLRDPWHSGDVQPERLFPSPASYFDHSSPLTPSGANDYVRFNGTAGEYWEDFDFAAYSSAGATFLGLNSLNNDNSTDGASVGGVFHEVSLGVPHFRFGFDQSNGLSREFSNSDPTAGFFLGRFTHEETSHNDFNYPQQGANPFSYLGAWSALADADSDGSVDSFEAGPRRGEDLLLSHVHSFEVLIWDSRIGDFVPVGHTRVNALGEEGDYHFNRNRQLAAGLTVVPFDPAAVPAGWSGHVFDTWHPQFDYDNADGDNVDATGSDPAPYRALHFYPTAAGYRAPQIDYWDPAATYESEDVNRNGILDPGEDGANAKWPVANGRLDGDKVFPPEPPGTTGTYDFYYECVIPTDTSASGPFPEPSWPKTKAGRTIHTGGTLPQFVAVPNIVPLSAIQIRVRFLHVASNKVRQLTLVHSLVDKPL